MPITIKSQADIEGMRAAGKLASQVLDFLTPFVKPNKTTNQLDKLAYEYMVDELKVTPAPLHYQPDPNRPPYPKSICTSVNHQVCHGIPNDKPLRKGDIMNIDVTIIKDGWHGDTSRMFMLGGSEAASVAARRLCGITYEAMWHGIAAIKAGNHINEIGTAIQRYAHSQGCSVVRDYCGHGVGKVFHEEPQVLHYKAGPNDKNAPNILLEAGMTITVEPMINAGKYETKSLPDGWTVVTKDHSLSAQWEHTILVTPTGFEVLTLSEGYPPLPAFIASVSN
jgi:methionyl aminopeptidase